MKATIKNISEKYNCDVFKDGKCYDNNNVFWVALEKQPLNDGEEQKFEYADGYTLKELLQNIESKIIK